MVGAEKGYKVLVVMSEGVSVERVKMLKSFGTKILFLEKVKERVLL